VPVNGYKLIVDVVLTMTRKVDTEHNTSTYLSCFLFFYYIIANILHFQLWGFFSTFSWYCTQGRNKGGGWSLSLSQVKVKKNKEKFGI